MTAHSGPCGQFLGALVALALILVLPGCTPPSKPIVSQAYSTHHPRKPEPAPSRTKPAEQAVVECSPTDANDLSAVEKTLLFQQFNRYYAANQYSNDPAGSDPKGANPTQSSVIKPSASQTALACPSAQP